MQLKISEVAAKAGVNQQTLRYYERRGILAEPDRTPAGYRQYEPETVDRVRFIKRAQELGFTLDEIQELLELRIEHGAACGAIEARARENLARVNDKVRQLIRLQEVLTDLVESCQRRQRTEECPILEALEG